MATKIHASIYRYLHLSKELIVWISFESDFQHRTVSSGPDKNDGLKIPVNTLFTKWGSLNVKAMPYPAFLCQLLSEILVVLVNSDRNDPVKRNIARYSNHWFVYSIVGSISLQDAITIGEKMTSRPAEDNKVAAANEGLWALMVFLMEINYSIRFNISNVTPINSFLYLTILMFRTSWSLTITSLAIRIKYYQIKEKSKSMAYCIMINLVKSRPIRHYMSEPPFSYCQI